MLLLALSQIIGRLTRSLAFAGLVAAAVLAMLGAPAFSAAAVLVLAADALSRRQCGPEWPAPHHT
jgi:hypothetical protein